MSADFGGTETVEPAEEQHGEKRRSSEAGSDSSWRIRKILKDLSYTSESEPLTPLNDTNANEKITDEKDENMSDSSSVVFVAQLKEPDSTRKPNYSGLAPNDSDDAYTETSYEDKRPPEEDVFQILDDPTGKVNDWLLQGQNRCTKPKRKKKYERTSNEYDFEDLSDSMFEWLLKVAEEYDAELQKLRNTISTLCKPSTQPVRKMYIDPDIIEISDDEEVNEEALADDSNGKNDEKINESGREETKTQPETDFNEINNNDIQTPTKNSSEPSQGTENEKHNETLEHDKQDNSEIVSNENVEDDSQNFHSNLVLPKIECSTEVSTPKLDEECTDLVQWLVND